jgi:hypothetical protein
MSRQPQVITDCINTKYNYKLKGVGPITHHLGGDFERDPDGTFKWGAKSYVNKMISNYEKMYGEVPRSQRTPIEYKYHPELDESSLLDADGVKQYQSMIGALQWLVSLGRFDIFCAVMTMSRFRVEPRQGHLSALKHTYGYLRNFKDGAIRFRTDVPDYSNYVPETYDWSYSTYGPIQEELPSNMPPPRGRTVVHTVFKDANLMHCLVTGRSASGILHLLNKTPIEWFSKRQATVETATYGSEFIAARQATEQTMDVRYTLRMLGVPVEGPSYMFGDNASVITSSTIPHSALGKRHNALSYHRVREAIAAGVLCLFHMDGKHNPADILTKFKPHHEAWPLVQPLLFERSNNGGNEFYKEVPSLR